MTIYYYITVDFTLPYENISRLKIKLNSFFSRTKNWKREINEIVNVNVCLCVTPITDKTVENFPDVFIITRSLPCTFCWWVGAVTYLTFLSVVWIFFDSIRLLRKITYWVKSTCSKINFQMLIIAFKLESIRFITYFEKKKLSKSLVFLELNTIIV